MYMLLHPVQEARGKHELAVERFRAARPSRADTPLWNAVLKALLELGRYDELHAMTQEITADQITKNIAAQALAREGWVEGLDFSSLDQIGRRTVVHELHSRGDLVSALRFFREADLPVRHPSDPHCLDLHGQNGAVACCAVRDALERGPKELRIVVGRATGSSSTVDTALGETVRELLRELGVGFEETSAGGRLVVPAQELKRFREAKELNSLKT